MIMKAIFSMIPLSMVLSPGGGGGLPCRGALGSLEGRPGCWSLIARDCTPAHTKLCTETTSGLPNLIVEYGPQEYMGSCVIASDFHPQRKKEKKNA